MGTNERKLLNHEKPIWRKAFEASLHHTSVEGATRNAWKAVDEWNRAGAFNEPQTSETRSHSDECHLYLEAFGVLRNWLGSMSAELSGNDGDRLWKTIKEFDDGEIGIENFKADLESIRPTA